jgi:hypothetical protein
MTLHTRVDPKAMTPPAVVAGAMAATAGIVSVTAVARQRAIDCPRVQQRRWQTVANDDARRQTANSSRDFLTDGLDLLTARFRVRVPVPEHFLDLVRPCCHYPLTVV